MTEGSWIVEQGITAAVLAAVMLVGGYTDVRWRRLPNWLTLGAAAFGLAYQLVTRGLDGGRESLLGWAFGCALLFLPFALGGMGAGDVKLLGAAGALKGAPFVFNAFVWTALAGGLLAIATLAARGTLWRTLRGGLFALAGIARSLIIYRSLPPLAVVAACLGGRNETTVGTLSAATGELKHFGIPYGVAIAAGSLLALFLPR